MFTSASDAPSTSFSPSFTLIFKLLPQISYLKKFSDSDFYLALSFSQANEDAIHNSNIIKRANNSSFVRSQLATDSLASEMMYATSFTPRFINYDFDMFKGNFLKDIGHSKPHDLLQWILRVANSLC